MTGNRIAEASSFTALPCIYVSISLSRNYLAKCYNYPVCVAGLE